MLKKKKSKKPTCNRCYLFDSTDGKEGFCKVNILYEGQKLNLPVYGTDFCFFEESFVDKNGEKFKPEIQQVRMWCEDEQGNPSDKGKVKIEYPEDMEFKST